MLARAHVPRSDSSPSASQTTLFFSLPYLRLGFIAAKDTIFADPTDGCGALAFRPVKPPACKAHAIMATLPRHQLCCFSYSFPYRT